MNYFGVVCSKSHNHKQTIFLNNSQQKSRSKIEGTEKVSPFEYRTCKAIKLKSIFSLIAFFFSFFWRKNRVGYRALFVLRLLFRNIFSLFIYADYISVFSFSILFRFTVNMAIAPWICILFIPYDEALLYP